MFLVRCLNVLASLFSAQTINPTEIRTGFIGNIFTTVGAFFWSIGNWLCDKIYSVCKWLMAFMDFLQYFIQKLIGLDYWLNSSKYTIGGALKNDLLFSFLYNDTVQKTFRALVGLSIVLLIIFTIFAIIKSEWAYITGGGGGKGGQFGDGSNSKASIIRGAIKAIAMVIIFPLVLMMGIISSDAILASLVKALNIDTGSTFGAALFNSSTQNANKYRNYASGSRYPIVDEITFYMYEDNDGTLKYLYVSPSSVSDTKTYVVKTYEQYVQTISEGKATKYTVTTMFTPINPSATTGFSGYCVALDIDGTTYYYLVNRGTNDRDALRYYLNNVLQVKIITSRGDGNSTLYTEIKSKAASYASDGYISNCNLTTIKKDSELAKAAWNTWGYLTTYMNNSISFDSSVYYANLKSGTSFADAAETSTSSLFPNGSSKSLMEILGFGKDTSAKIMFNSNTISSYFDGGQFGLVQLQSEYYVMSDVVDFIAESGLRLYMVNANSSMIRWNYENYQIGSAWIGNVDSSTGAASVTTNKDSYYGGKTSGFAGTKETDNILYNKIPLMVSYSNIANDIEAGNTLYLADASASSEKNGAVYIMCLQVPEELKDKNGTVIGKANRFIPLLNNTTYTDSITQKTYRFSSSYYTNNYKGVVIARGLLDNSSLDSNLGYPTYIQEKSPALSGVDVSERTISGESESEYYYKMELAGSINSYVDTSSYSGQFNSYKDAGQITGYLDTNKFEYWVEKINDILIDSVLYNNTNIDNFNFSDTISVGNIYAKNSDGTPGTQLTGKNIKFSQSMSLYANSTTPCVTLKPGSNKKINSIINPKYGQNFFTRAGNVVFSGITLWTGDIFDGGFDYGTIAIDMDNYNGVTLDSFDINVRFGNTNSSQYYPAIKLSSGSDLYYIQVGNKYYIFKLSGNVASYSGSNYYCINIDYEASLTLDELSVFVKKGNDEVLAQKYSGNIYKANFDDKDYFFELSGDGGKEGWSWSGNELKLDVSIDNKPSTFTDKTNLTPVISYNGRTYNAVYGNSLECYFFNVDGNYYAFSAEVKLDDNGKINVSIDNETSILNMLQMLYSTFEEGETKSLSNTEAAQLKQFTYVDNGKKLAFVQYSQNGAIYLKPTKDLIENIQFKAANLKGKVFEYDSEVEFESRGLTIYSFKTNDINYGDSLGSDFGYIFIKVKNNSNEIYLSQYDSFSVGFEDIDFTSTDVTLVNKPASAVLSENDKTDSIYVSSINWIGDTSTKYGLDKNGRHYALYREDSNGDKIYEKFGSENLSNISITLGNSVGNNQSSYIATYTGIYNNTIALYSYTKENKTYYLAIEFNDGNVNPMSYSSVYKINKKDYSPVEFNDGSNEIGKRFILVDNDNLKINTISKEYELAYNYYEGESTSGKTYKIGNMSAADFNNTGKVENGYTLFTTANKVYIQVTGKYDYLSVYFQSADGGKSTLDTSNGGNGLINLGSNGELSFAKAISSDKVKSESAYYKFYLYDFYSGYISNESKVYSYKNGQVSEAVYNADKTIMVFVDKNFNWEKDSSSYALYNGKEYIATIYKNYGTSCDSAKDIASTSLELLYNYRTYYNIQTHNSYTTQDNFKNYYNEIEDSFIITFNRTNIKIEGIWDFTWLGIFNGFWRLKATLGTYNIERDVQFKSVAIKINSGIAFDYFFDDAISLETFYMPSKISYWVIIFASVIIIKVLATSIWGVIKRFYEITLYFLAMPVVASTMPLDDGQRFKQSIQKPIFDKVLGTYGVILGLNVFFVLLTPIRSLSQVFTAEDIATSGSYFLSHLSSLFHVPPSGVAKNLNNFVYILFMLVAFTMIETLPATVSKIIGIQGDVYGDGKQTKDIAKKQARDTFNTVSGNTAVNLAGQAFKGAKNMGLTKIAGGVAGLPFKTIGKIRGKIKEGEDSVIAKNDGAGAGAGAKENSDDASKSSKIDDENLSEEVGGGAEAGSTGGEPGESPEQVAKNVVAQDEADDEEIASENMGFSSGGPQTQLQKKILEAREKHGEASASEEQYNKENAMTTAGDGDGDNTAAIAEATGQFAEKVKSGNASSQDKTAVTDLSKTIVDERVKKDESAKNKAGVEGFINSTADDASNADKLIAMKEDGVVDKKDQKEFEALFDENGNLKDDDESKQKQKEFLSKYQFGITENEGKKALTVAKLDKKGNVGEAKTISNDSSKKVIESAEQKQAENKEQPDDKSIENQINAVGNATADVKQDKLNGIRSRLTGEQRTAFDKQFEGLSATERARKEDEVLQKYEFSKNGDDLTVTAKDGSLKNGKIDSAIAKQIISKTSKKASKDKSIDNVLNGENGLMKNVSTATKFEAARSTLSKQERDELDAKTKGKSGAELEKIQQDFLKDYKITGTQDENGKTNYVAQKLDKNGNVVSMKKVGDEAQSKIASEMVTTGQIGTSEISNAVKSNANTNNAINNAVAKNILLASNSTTGNLNATLVNKLDKMEGEAASVARGKAIADALGETDAGRGIRNRVLAEMGINNFDEIRNDPEKMKEFALLLDKKRTSKEDVEYSNYLIDHDKEYSEKLLERGKEAARKGDIVITAYDIATEQQKAEFKEKKAQQKSSENILEGATEEERKGIVSSFVRRFLTDDKDGKTDYTRDIANKVFANSVTDNELDGLTDEQIRQLTGNKSYKRGDKLTKEDRARIGFAKKQFNVKHASDIDFSQEDKIKNSLSTFDNKAELSKQVQQFSDQEIYSALNKNPNSRIMKDIACTVSENPELAISELQKQDIDDRQRASIEADIRKENPELKDEEVKKQVEQEFNSDERIKERQTAYRAKANSSIDSIGGLSEEGKKQAQKESVELLKRDKDAQLLLLGSSESIVGRTTIIEGGIQQLIGVETEEDAQEYIKLNMSKVSQEKIQELHNLGLSDIDIAMNHKKAMLAGQIEDNDDEFEVIRGIKRVKDGNTNFDSIILSNMQKNALKDDATQEDRDVYIKARDYILSGSNVSEKSMNEMIEAAAGSGVAALDEANKDKLTRTIAVDDIATKSAIKREITLSKIDSKNITDDELLSSIKTNDEFAKIFKQNHNGNDIKNASNEEIMKFYKNKDLFDNAKLRTQIQDNAKTRKILKENDPSLTDDALNRMSESELNSKLDDYIITNKPEGTSDEAIEQLIDKDENGVISNALNKHPELMAKVDKKSSSMTYTEVLDYLNINNKVEGFDIVSQARQDEDLIESVKQDMVKVSDEDVLNDIKLGKDKKVTAEFKKKFETKTKKSFESASDEDLMVFLNSEEASDLKSKTANARKLELAASIKDEDITDGNITAYLDKNQDIKESVKLKAKKTKQEEAELEKGVKVSDEEIADSFDDSNEFTEATRAAALKDIRFVNFVKKSGNDIDKIETAELSKLFKEFSSDNLNLTASRDIKKNARLITTIAKNKKIDVNSKESRDKLNNIVSLSNNSKELNENLTERIVKNENAEIVGDNKDEEVKKIKYSAMRTNEDFRNFVNENSKKDIRELSETELDDQFKLFKENDKVTAEKAEQDIAKKADKLTYLMVTSGNKLGTERSDKYLNEISKFDDAKLDKAIQTRAFKNSLTQTELDTYTKQAQNQKLATHALEKEVANRSSSVGKEVAAYAEINKDRYNEYLREHGIKVEDATNATLSAFYVSEMTRNDDNFKKTTKQAQEIVDMEAQTESFVALDKGKKYKTFLKQNKLKDSKFARLKFFQTNNFNDENDKVTTSMLSVSNSYAMIKKGTVEGKVIENFAKVNAKEFEEFVNKDENKGQNRDLLKAKFFEEQKAKLEDTNQSNSTRFNIQSKMHTAEIMSNIELNTKLGEEIDKFTGDKKNASKYNNFKKKMQEDSKYGYNVDENVIKAEFYNKYSKSTLQRIGEKLPGPVGNYVELAGMTRKSRFERKSKKYDTVSDTTLEGLKEKERQVRSAGKTAQEFFKGKNFVMKKAKVVDDIEISDDAILDFAQENGEEIKDQAESNRKMLESSTAAQFKAYSNYSDIDDDVANDAVKIYANINSENVDSKAQEIKKQLNLTADQKQQLVLNGISTNEQLVVAYEKAKLASGNGKVDFTSIMDTKDITKSNNINKLALQTMQSTSQDSDENRRNFNEALKVVNTALSKDGLRTDVINETVAGTENSVFQKDYVEELKLTEDTTGKSISGVLADENAMYASYTNSSIMNKETNNKAIIATIDDANKQNYLSEIKSTLGRKAKRYTDDELLASYEKLRLAGKTVDENGNKLKKKDLANAVISNIGSDELDKVALQKIKDNDGKSYEKARDIILDGNNLSLQDKNKLAVEAGKNGASAITETQKEDLRVELAKDDREAVATAYRDKYIEDTKVETYELDDLLRSGGDNSSAVNEFRKNFEKDHNGKKIEFATNDEIEKYYSKFSEEHEDIASDIVYRAKVQSTLKKNGIDASRMTDEKMNQALDAEIEKNPDKILLNEIRKDKAFATALKISQAIDIKDATDEDVLNFYNTLKNNGSKNKKSTEIIANIDKNVDENTIIKESLNKERNSKLVEKLDRQASTLDYTDVAGRLGINVTENRVELNKLTNEEQDFAKLAIASKDEKLVNEAKANQVLALNTQKTQKELEDSIKSDNDLNSEYEQFKAKSENAGLEKNELVSKFYKESVANGNTAATNTILQIAKKNNIQVSNNELLNVANNHETEIQKQLETMDTFKLGDTISEGKEVAEDLKQKENTTTYKSILDKEVESKVYANSGNINNDVANNAVKEFSSINTEKKVQSTIKKLENKKIDVYELRNQAAAIGINSDEDLAIAYNKAVLAGKINDNSSREEIKNAILGSNSAETNQLALQAMLDSKNTSKSQKVQEVIHNSLSDQEKSSLALKLEQDATLGISTNDKKDKIFDYAKADSESYKLAEREAKKEKILEETKQNLTIKEKVEAAKNNKEFKDRFKREYKSSGARNIDEFYQMFEKDSENALYIEEIEHDASLKKLSQQDSDKNGIGEYEKTFKSQLLRKTLLSNAEFKDAFKEENNKEANEKSTNKELFDFYNSRRRGRLVKSSETSNPEWQQYQDIIDINESLSAGLKEYRKKSADEQLNSMLDAREAQGVAVNVSKDEIINKLGKDKVAEYETKVRNDAKATQSNLIQETTIDVASVVPSLSETTTETENVSKAKTRDEILNEYKSNPELLRKAKEDYAKKMGITLKSQKEVNITVSNSEISNEILNGDSAKSEEIRQKIKDSRPQNKKTISNDAVIDSIENGKTEKSKQVLDEIKQAEADRLNSEEKARVAKENADIAETLQRKEFAELAIGDTISRYNSDVESINKQNKDLGGIANQDREKIKQQLDDNLYTVDKKGNKIKNPKYETEEFKKNYNKFIEDFINHGHIGSFDQFKKLGINDMELYNRIATDSNEKELNRLYNTYTVSQSNYNRGLDAKKNLDSKLKSDLNDDSIKRFVDKSIVSKYEDKLGIAYTQDEIDQMKEREIVIPEAKQPKLVKAEDVSISRDDIKTYINGHSDSKDAIQSEIVNNNYDNSDVTKEEIEAFMGNRDNSTDVSEIRKEIKDEKIGVVDAQKTYTAEATKAKSNITASRRMSFMQIKKKYETAAKKREMVDTVYKTESSLITVDQLQQSFAESDDENGGERATKIMGRFLNGSGNADDIDLSDASSRQLDEKTKEILLKKAKVDRSIQLTDEELKNIGDDEKAKDNALISKYIQENESALYEARAESKADAKTEKIKKMAMGVDGTDAVIAEFARANKSDYNRIVTKFQKTHQGLQFSELDVTEQNKYLASMYQNNVSNELVQNKYLENLVKKGVIRTSDGTTSIVDSNGEINAEAFKQLKNNLMKEKGNMTIEQYLSSGKADKYLDQKSTREYVEKVANRGDGSLEKLAISKMDSSVFSSLHKKISSDLTDETNDVFDAEKKAIVEKKVEQRLAEGKVNPISALPDLSKMTERENREFSATKIMLSNQIRENTNPAILKNILNNTNLVNEDQILRELAKAQNIDIKAFENEDKTINKTALMQVLDNDTVNNYFNKNIEMRDTMLSIGANDLTTTLSEEQRKQKNIDAINSNENLKNEMLLETLKKDEHSHNINIKNRILLLSRQKTSISSGEKNDIERDVRNSLKKELIAEMKRMNPNKSEQEIAKSISDKKLDEYIKTRKISNEQIMSNVLSSEEIQSIATDVRASNAGKSETEIQNLINNQIQDSSNVKIASMFGINTDGLNANQVSAEIDKLKSSGQITNGLIDQKLRISSKQSTVVERKLAEQNNMYKTVTNEQVRAVKKDYKSIAADFGIFVSGDKFDKSQLNKALVSADRLREIEGDIRENNNGLSDTEISKLVDVQVEKEANEKIAQKYNLKIGTNAVDKKALDQKIYNDAMMNEQQTRLEIAKAEYTDNQGNIKKSAKEKVSEIIEKEKNSTNLTNFRENLYEQVKKNISYTANMSEQDLTQFFEVQEMQKSQDLSIANGVHSMHQDIANFFTGVGQTVAGTPHAVAHEFKGAIYNMIRRTPGNSSSYNNWNKTINNQIAEVKQGLGAYKDLTREQRLAEIDKLQDKLIFTGKNKPSNYASMSAEEKRAWTNNQTKLKAEAFASKDFSYIRKKDSKVNEINKIGRKKFTDNFGYAFGFQGRNVSEGVKEQHKKDLAVMKSKITEYNATKGSMNFANYDDFSAMAKKYLGDKGSTDRVIKNAKNLNANERAKLLEEAMAKKYKIASHRVAHDSGLKRKDFLEERGIGETVVRYKDATKKYTALKSSINTHLPIPGINALVNAVAYQTKKGIVNHYDKNNGQVNRLSKFMYDRVYGLRYGDSKAAAIARKNNLELGMKRIEELNLTFKGTSTEYAREIDKILGSDAAKVYGKNFKLYNRNSAVAIQKRGVLKTLSSMVEKENRRINYKSNVIPATYDSSSKYIGQALTNSKTAAQKATDKQIAEELNNSLNIVLNQKSISSFDAVYARLLPQIREQFENRKFGKGRSLSGMTDAQKFAILENFLQKKLERANNRVQNNSMLRTGTEQLEKLNGRYYKSSELERSKMSPTMVNAVMNSDARYKELAAKCEADRVRYLTEKQNRDYIQNELQKLIDGPRNSYTKLQIQTLNENLYESNTKLKVLKTALNKSESMKKTFELAYAQRQIEEARKVQAMPNSQFGGLFDEFNVYQYMVGPDGRYMRDKDGRYMRKPIDPHSPHAKELGMMTRRFMNDYRIQVYRMRFALRNQRYADYEMQKELTRISKKVDGNFNEKLTSMRSLMNIMDRKIEKLKTTNNREQLEYRNHLIEQRTRLERIKTEFATSMNDKNFKLEEKILLGDQKSAIRDDQLKAQLQSSIAKNVSNSTNSVQKPQRFKANESYLTSSLREHKHLKPARNIKNTDEVDE